MFVLLQTTAQAETIHYNILQLGVKAGEATLTFVGLTEYKTRPVFLIEFKSQGMNFLDEEKIYLHPEDLRPDIVNRNLNIFGHKEKIFEEYKQKEGIVRVIKEVNEKFSEQKFIKGVPLDNIYGFIYRYRKNGSFKIGETLKVILPTKDLTIQLTRQVSLTIGNKTYDCFYMQSKPSKYKIWFDSVTKLPVKISGAIGIANTAMVMTSYEK